MWTCGKCKRIFQKENQSHSCQSIPLEQHFKNKKKAREIFDYLVKRVNKEIGEVKLISLPCCIHLFGSYDFLAALPKKDRLEIRLSLKRIDLFGVDEINEELIKRIKESYCLKN